MGRRRYVETGLSSSAVVMQPTLDLRRRRRKTLFWTCPRGVWKSYRQQITKAYDSRNMADRGYDDLEAGWRRLQAALDAYAAARDGGAEAEHVERLRTVYLQSEAEYRRLNGPAAGTDASEDDAAVEPQNESFPHPRLHVGLPPRSRVAMAAVASAAAVLSLLVINSRGSQRFDYSRANQDVQVLVEQAQTTFGSSATKVSDVRYPMWELGAGQPSDVKSAATIHLHNGIVAHCEQWNWARNYMVDCVRD